MTGNEPEKQAPPDPRAAITDLASAYIDGANACHRRMEREWLYETGFLKARPL